MISEEEAIEQALSAAAIEDVSPCSEVTWDSPTADVVEVKTVTDLTGGHELADIEEAD